MGKYEIDEIPSLVASGTITKTEAVRIMAKELFLCPYRFGLSRYDDDFRSEVILDFLVKGHLVVDRFAPSSGGFRPYLFAFVQGLILTQKRNRIRQFVSESSVQQFAAGNDCVTQSDDVPACSAAEQEPSVRYSLHTDGRSIWKTLSRQHGNKNPVQAKAALILALKSCYYVRSDDVDKVSSCCRLEGAEIQRLVRELNSHLYCKIEKREQFMVNRDNAYYFHRKYYLQLKYGSRDSLSAAALGEKYRKQTENWLRKNSMLRQCRYRISPSNKMIADLLGICERQVSYYIGKARELSDQK